MRAETKSQTESLSLPHSPEAERATLGVILCAPETLQQIPFLEPDHFHDRRNGEAFRVMREMITAGRQTDHITLREPLSKTFASDKAFDDFIRDVLSEAATSVNVRDYGRRVYELAQRRELLKIAEHMQRKALLSELDVTPSMLIADTERKLCEIKVADSPDFDFRDMLRKKFTLVDDLEANIVKEEIVAGVLGVGELSCWYGQPGAAKSVLVEDLAMHVACGLPWHGRKVRQGAVVYVALEREALVKRRAVAFRISKDVQGAPFAIVGGVYDLRDPGAAAQLVGVIRDVERATEQKVALVVIDTVSRALCGSNENSPEDMGAVVASDSILKAKTGAHVAWIHHSPIGAERLRGHSALLGAMDVTISVAKNGNIRTATIDKINDGMDGLVTTFQLESVVVGKDGDGKETTAPIVVQIDDAAAMGKPSPSRLPKAAEIAFRALTDMILDHGVVPPASTYIPANTRVVDMDAWRQHAYRRGISASDQPRAKQQAFARAVEQLLTAGRVATYDDKVWLIS